jgi:PAS domain S-box-containing protein
MSEHELSASVESARQRLTALRARLESEGTEPGSPAINIALRELQETLDKMQARYGLLRDILDRTNDLVFAKNRDGRYAMINPRGAEMFGKSMSEVLGVDDRSLFEHVDAERIMATDREVMDSGKPQTSEATLKCRGIPTTLLTTTTTWYDADRLVRGVIGISQDVTERRRHEREAVTDHDRMRSMATEIVLAEELLRRTLAAELQSGLGQDIALARMKLGMLHSSASADLHPQLSAIERLVERADHSLRSITFQISPPSLHDLGLVAAFEWLAEDVAARYGIDVRIQDDDFAVVADERVRAILYRAVRELLINAATHAQVREVVVRITRDDKLVRIEVEDSGPGFDTTGLEQRGYGLLGIREQLKYVDGTMQIKSALGHGTTVTLAAPAADPVARSTP